MTAFLVRVLVNTLAIALAASVIPGVELDGVVPALAAGLVLGFINALIRPILLILTLPITFVTLGLFILVVNGLCFWFVAWLIDGFRVKGFWPAVGGALVVSVLSWALTALTNHRNKVVVITRGDD
ncbi:MAG TPA: phage holin family protein [Methylomirabilota bacterium]|jgi:putative membrane protein|nr:phage holin family protein [Methylomirabilota bacterium]